MRYGIKHLALLFVVFPLLAARSNADDTLASLGWEGGELVELSASSAGAANLDSQLIREVGFGGGGELERSFPGMFFRAEALFWQRNRSRYKVLSVDDNETFDNLADDTPFITTKNLDFDYEPGWRVELGVRLGTAWPWKARSSRFRISIPPVTALSNGVINTQVVEDAFSPPAVPDFATLNADDYYNALFHRAVYVSQLLSAEMNLRATWRHNNLIRSESIGIRFVQIRDRLTFETQDDRLATFSDGLSDYLNDIHNDMIGVQYGQDVTVPILSSLSLTGHIKTGLYGNHMEQASKMINNGGLVVNVERDGGDVAVISELGVNANIKLTEFLTIRGGYNMMWVDGVALAPDQFTFVPGAQQSQKLNDNGDLFYQGFNIGIELIK